MPSSAKENTRTPLKLSGRKKGGAMINSDSASAFGSPSRTSEPLSPPPEDELRYLRRGSNEPSSASKPLASSIRSNQKTPIETQTTKRKRTITGLQSSPGVLRTMQESANQHTPNPRLRKQVRHAGESPTVSPSQPRIRSRSRTPLVGEGIPSHMQEDVPMTPTHKGKSREMTSTRTLVPQSPHAKNPHADYIPPDRLALSPKGVSFRRRSVTPIPPYEPPPERYTPPREIILSPIAVERKPARRTAQRKKRASTKGDKPSSHLRIKTEPPEIDLTAPAPPVSPSEDPILLVGPPIVRVQRPSPAHHGSADPASLVDFEMELDIPADERRSISRPARSNISSPFQSSDSVIPPVFDFSNINEGTTDNGWMNTSSEMDFGDVIDDGMFTGGAGGTDDGWSDTDTDDGGDENVTIGEGEYTGRFLTYVAPMKLDSPTNASRERMEEWGRPISPHPKRLSFAEPKEEDTDEDIIPLQDHSNETGRENAQGEEQSTANTEDVEEHQEVQQEDYQEDRLPGYEDRRGRRLTLSEVEAIKFGSRRTSPTITTTDDLRNNGASDISITSIEQDTFIVHQDNSFSEQDISLDISMGTDTIQQNIVLDEIHAILNNNLKQLKSNPNPEIDNREDSNVIKETNNEPVVGQESARSSAESSQSTLTNDNGVDYRYRTTQPIDEQDDADKSMRGREFGKRKEGNVRQGPMRSFSPSQNIRAPQDIANSDCETEIIGDDEEEPGDDSDVSDVSVIKIMSDDPMAAARAAAILKMHDYDMVARKLRRKSMSAGISKAYSTPQKMRLWRRRTIAGLTAEDALDANVSLPALLEKAEQDLRTSPARGRSGSLALSSSGTPQKERHHSLLYEDANTSGIREWSKEDWKLLDSCFTDERYDIGEDQGFESGRLADVDDIRLENVVERFIDLMGGSSKVEGHGPAWAEEKLMNRVKALYKRQRAGHGAPPTPDVSARFSTPSRFLSPSMVVPDFTPMSIDRVRLFDEGVLPQPSSEPFFKASLNVPMRHSHLRDDVTSSVLETPRGGRALGLFGYATPTRGGGQDSDEESIAQEVEAMLTPVTASRIRESEPASAVKRSLNYISSWLKPDTYKSRKDERKGSQFPGLPVPPSDILAKPRGLVETPAPRPAEKIVHPKDQVTLDHVPLSQPSRLPKIPRPRRLVDLQHVPTPQPKEERKRVTIRRKSSVKDLVKEFEEKEEGKVQVLPPRVAELRRQASVGSLKGKPQWRP